MGVGVAETKRRIGLLTGEPVEAAELSAEVGVALSGLLPFDGWCLFGLDPRTGLRTMQVGGRGTEKTAEMARNEALMTDVNRWAALATSRVGAGWLSRDHPAATTSFRLNEILVPVGFESELRLLLRDRSGVWGALALFREDPSRTFGDKDLPTLAAVAPELAEVVRAFPVRPLPKRGAGRGAGLAVLSPDDHIVSLGGAADAWLDDLVPGGDDETFRSDVTRVLFDAAHAVRRGDTSGASTCLRTVSGQWLRVEAFRLAIDGADVGVALQPATVEQLLATVVAHHGLTGRESEVLELAVRGLAGKQIARRLRISLLTVNGHLTSVYRKCGVTGREELVGRLV